jgi:hypothetical protein
MAAALQKGSTLAQPLSDSTTSADLRVPAEKLPAMDMQNSAHRVTVTTEVPRHEPNSEVLCLQ